MTTKFFFRSTLAIAGFLFFTSCNNDDTPNFSLTDKIPTAVLEMYPNAHIVDLEQDRGYTEVDIIYNQKEMEVTFNGAGEWVATNWDLPYNQLPQQVSEALNTAGYNVTDYECKAIKTCKSELTVYEVEARKGQGHEQDIYIDETGKILYKEF